MQTIVNLAGETTTKMKPLTWELHVTRPIDTLVPVHLTFMAELGATQFNIFPGGENQ